MKLLLLLSIVPAAIADTVVMRDGANLEGTYLGGDARAIRVAVGESVRTIEVSKIQSIRFGSTGSKADPQGKSAVFRPDHSLTETVAPKPPDIPSGTQILIRMIDSIDSERDSAGTKFRASLLEPIVVNGRILAAKGAAVTTVLLDNKQSGKYTGKTELTLDLLNISIGGHDVELVSNAVTRESSSQTGKTAKRTGGGAALGAIVGAIAGGGKGAAIGAAAGGGAGAASQIWTKGQRVLIPSETRLTFVLQETVKL